MRISGKAAVTIAVAGALVFFAGANAEEAKALKIKECMACQNEVRSELPKLAKAKDWETAAEKSKSWLAAAGDIGKNKPPLGDDKSWKEQTDKYFANVKAVDSAVGNKDADAVAKTVGNFNNSCGACHSKHKPAKKR